MHIRAQQVRRAVLAVCTLAGAAALGCAATPHRDGSSPTSARLDVSAPAVLSYRPLSASGEKLHQRFQPSPRTHAGERLLIRDRRGKQMAAYDAAQWAGQAP